MHPISGATIENANKIKNDLYKSSTRPVTTVCCRSRVFTVQYTCLIRYVLYYVVVPMSIPFCTVQLYPCFLISTTMKTKIPTVYKLQDIHSEMFFSTVQYTCSTKIFGFDFHVVLQVPVIQYEQSWCRK
jgi:hypothetical protein